MEDAMKRNRPLRKCSWKDQLAFEKNCYVVEFRRPPRRQNVMLLNMLLNMLNVSRTGIS